MKKNQAEFPQSSPESLKKEVIIQFGPEGHQQKFIEIESEGNVYIISFPEALLHNDIARKAELDLFKNKDFFVRGGGSLVKEAQMIGISGQSQKYGRFNEKRVASLLKEAFPSFKITTD